MTAPASSRQSLRLGGALLSWLEAGSGDGRPLVLLHGIGSNARSWEPVLPLLAAGRRVIAWDAPGYRGSDPLPEGAADGAYADALAALLNDRGVSGALVVGHSLGALVAADLALRHPGLTAGLVLADPAVGNACPPGAPWPEPVAERLRELETLGAEAFAAKRAARLCAPGAPQDVLAAVRTAMAEVRLAGYGRACGLLARGDLIRAVAGLRLPGLVTCGALDAVVPPAKARLVAQAWPGAGYVEIPGVGHAGYVEDPAAYAAPILTFAETLS